MKKGTIVKIIASNPTADQIELDLNNYIGVKCEVIEHWKQKSNNDWVKGQVQVNLQGEGLIILNKGEYEMVK